MIKLILWLYKNNIKFVVINQKIAHILKGQLMCFLISCLEFDFSTDICMLQCLTIRDAYLFNMLWLNWKILFDLRYIVKLFLQLKFSI